jgi:hypothetical protein
VLLRVLAPVACRASSEGTVVTKTDQAADDYGCQMAAP